MKSLLLGVHCCRDDTFKRSNGAANTEWSNNNKE